jgi:hypothetical protein
VEVTFTLSFRNRTPKNFLISDIKKQRKHLQDMNMVMQYTLGFTKGVLMRSVKVSLQKRWFSINETSIHSRIVINETAEEINPSYVLL